jgi:hypothetical protein
MSSRLAQSAGTADDWLRSEHGLALLVAVMALLFMTALGGAVIMTTTTEVRIASSFRTASEAFHAADAGLERSLNDLFAMADWSIVLSGVASSSFVDGSPGVRTLADGTVLDLHQVVNRANCQKPACSASDYSAVTVQRPWGANNPQWQLFAHGPLSSVAPGLRSPFYVVVLVGDDQSDTDGNPLQDGGAPENPGTGVLALRAEAFGPRGAHRVIEMTVARADDAEAAAGVSPPRVRILSWREVS